MSEGELLVDCKTKTCLAFILSLIDELQDVQADVAITLSLPCP